MPEFELIKTYIAARNYTRGPYPPSYASSLLLWFEQRSNSGTGRSVTDGTTTSESAMQSLKHLDDTAEILRYRVEAPAFFKALHGLCLLPEDEVKSLQQDTLVFLTSDYSLAQVGVALQQLRARLCNMTPSHLKFVSLLHSRGGLLVFLETFDSLDALNSQAAVVTTQTHGRDFESRIVTTLLDASRKLWRFTRYHAHGAASCKFDTLSQLYDEVGPESRDLDALMAKTVDLATNIEDLKVSTRFISTLLRP